MIKKSTLFLGFIFLSLMVKAQIQPIVYESNTLSEEKIQSILKDLRKSGVKKIELQKTNTFLHNRLKLQNEAIANGTWQQKMAMPPPQVMTGCVNPGFETNTITGWVLTQGTASGQNLPCPTCFSASGGVYEITGINSTSSINNNTGNTVGGDISYTCTCSNTNTNDCTPEPYINGVDRFGGFPVVAPAPLGGQYSLMLNNSNCGYLMQRANYSFLVDATNSSFTYQFAAVLQDGGHAPIASPYFSVTVTDVTTNSLVPCAQFSVQSISSGNLNGWSVSPVDASVYYKPWQTVTTDLTALIGHTVSLTFDVSDCNAGGHFGYAYIDASCGSLQITASNALCTGGSTTLSGPPGLSSYTWSGPVSGAGQNLFTSTPGNYTLTTTSASGCPSPTLYYNLTQSATTSTTTVNIQVSKDTICSGTTTTLTASGASTYVWSNNASGNSITVSPTANTTYTVLGTDNSGCGDTAVSKTINVIANNLLIQATNDSICPGATDVLTASGANTYTWSSNASSATTSTVSVSPAINSTYTVTGINGSGCTYSVTKTISIKSCGTTGVSQFITSNQVSVYPNPATEMLYIECPLKNATLYITDILGNKIKQTLVESELTTVDISSLSKGVYFLNVKTATNVITKKFIVQR